MNVTAITCAVHRPEAFTLCEKYVERQTVKPSQWLVLDDDEIPTVCTMGQEYHYWPECRGRGSLARKIKRALTEKLITGDAIVFIENDDWYAPDFIQWCIAGLRNFSIYGEGRALYYNVKHRYWFEHQNLRHASLCATAIRGDFFPLLLTQCMSSDEPYVDELLWRRCTTQNRVADPYAHPSRFRRSVGIKGMPGKSGYGGGHRGRDKAAVDDLTQIKLRSLIGKDADFYASFYDSRAVPPPPERNNHIVRTSPKPDHMLNVISRSEAGRVHGPQWSSWLAHLVGKDAVGMEIGTFEGDSAEWMLENIFTSPGSSYHCVDTFGGSVEHHIGKIATDKLEQTTREKLSRFPNAVIHKGFSQQVVRAMTQRFDFVYVDGDHSSMGALRDAVLAFDLLNVGGIMIFDDYQWAVMPNELDRPKTGIDAFIRSYGKQLEVLTPRGWQIAIRKRAD